MKPAGIHHVAICVKDLDESIRFYTDALGFTVAPRPDVGMAGAWLDAAGQQVHLMVVDEPDLPKRNHFAVRVDDLQEAADDLKAKGIEVLVLDPPIPGAGRQAFLSDPSGNNIELNQPVS